ncbi:ABC transporter ATP-binding protein [Clostridia bacterium]|nr:ABC transporter ATP-binding protein [Clostridia bacterium]
MKKNSPNIRSGRGHGGPASRFSQEKPKLENPRKTVLRLFSYMDDQKIMIFWTTILVVVTTALTVFAPILMGKAVDDYILLGDVPGLVQLLLVLSACYLAIGLFTYIQTRLMIRVSQVAVKRLRNELFSKLQSFSLRFFDTHSHGDLMSRMTNDIDNISNTLSQSVTQLVSNTLTLVGVTIMMFVINWQLGAITVLMIPVTFILMGLVGKKTRKNFSSQQGNLGNINGMVEEYCTGHQVVKAYGREEAVIKDFQEKNQKLVKASIKAQIYSGMMMPLMIFLNNFSYAVVISAGAVFYVYGLLTLGVITIFMNYARQFGRPLNQIAQLYNTIQLAIAGAERVFEIMDQEPEVKNSKQAIQVEKLNGNVRFDRVNFAYDPEKPILKDVSLEAKSGETIALVGPTGAGKTTIINLLTRFYDIQKGSITIDGQNIVDLEKESLREKLGIVLQDTYLFSGTVRENIRYGRLTATDEEVEEAAKLANAHLFIHRLPEGYDTHLTEEGSNLSQGQRQLLAIARAILASPDILILDEATSSVDTRTESHIQEALLRLMEGRTSFVIAHRLSTIRKADQILVIDDGRIVERGSHEELMDKQGFYYRMIQSQYKSKAS